jgi:hypothetical protein
MAEWIRKARKYVLIWKVSFYASPARYLDAKAEMRGQGRLLHTIIGSPAGEF